MDYEKKNKEALGWMQSIYPTMTGANKEDAEHFFPELKENKEREDERIRKEIITYLSTIEDKDLVPYESWIAWLEKQAEQKPYGQRKKCSDCQFNYAGECNGSCQMKIDEQKPADKVEPKFKAGNWYKCTKDFFGKGVTFDKNTAYYCAQEGCLQNEYGCHIAIVKDLYDNLPNIVRRHSL